MILSTFDKEVYEKDLKEEAYDEGYNKRLRDQIEKKIAKGKTTEQIADELEETTEVIRNIIDSLNLKK